MPPASCVGTSVGSLAADVFTFSIPQRASDGDQLVAIIMSDPGDITAFAAGAGEDNAAIASFTSLAGANADVLVVRVPFSSALGPLLTLKANAAPTWALAALLCVRGLENVNPVTSARATVTASTNFPMQSLVLGRYSDLYLGIVAVTSAAVAVHHPLFDNARSRELIEIQSGGRTLEVYAYWHENNGATGTPAQATTDAAQTGVSSAIAFRANITVPALELPTTVPGAIGFVDIGV